ncbi:MAG: histidine kinase, partial [Clostridia bacterium]|nr:histidine kinase [Clostridia bacterium]
DDVFIIGSRERIGQVIEILLDNACKHACKNGIVNITLIKKGSKTCITVVNQGEVISEEDLTKIF